MRQLLAGTALAVTVLTGATIADAQRSSTSKFFVGLALNGSALDAEELTDGAESGGGGGLTIGYGFTQRFALYFEGTTATISGEDTDYSLSHFDFGARYHFTRPASMWAPYIEAALSGRAAWKDDVTLGTPPNTFTGDVEVSGTGFTLGAGLLVFFNPKWALNANVKWTNGEFSDVEFGSLAVSDLEIDATSTRLSIGITWFPRGGSQ